jgi:phosphoribosylaminoimidazolecarboxamide formyltransferase/IMP cyclohydrolase
MPVALISVHDKAGVAEFSAELSARGFELMATGGTAAVLRSAGLPVTEASDYTGAAELIGGRVKTLHPRIHAGILYKRGSASHEDEVARNGVKAIDIVVVNLYPFEAGIAAGASEDELIELIDIGGVALTRAAAKNWEDVAIVTSSSQYATVVEELRNGGHVANATRREFAKIAFALTAAYDSAIARHFGAGFPEKRVVEVLEKVQELRYGENPHQRGALYAASGVGAGPSVSGMRQLQGKEMSYNNFLDSSFALKLALEDWGSECSCSILKHANACGGATGKTPVEAYAKALACDPTSAFGGIVSFNRPLDASAAGAIAERFFEVVIAPGFEPQAIEVLSEKKNLRVLDASNFFAAPRQKEVEYRSILGGVLVQESDCCEEGELSFPTKVKPSGGQVAAMEFALKYVKHCVSNAIVLAVSGQAIGFGIGQTSRVDSVRIAVERARKNGFEVAGSSMASEAFFPFRDAIDSAADAGVAAIIQPGGSIRDGEVVAACNERGIAMAFSGHRHFRH